ncbi:MAG: RHS repeat-associated core domain-containing protein [Cellulophaga sp.]|uniref:RHS repeat-associated core domain-containing protein n=1 Tax=Cellulophaga sp. TaxID=1972202 RepID=UPI0032670ED8
MAKTVGGLAHDVVADVGKKSPGKSFGELFSEKKTQLDSLQKDLAAAIMPSIPGQPAGKFSDMGIGVDFHSTVVPPSPMCAVPNVFMVYDMIAAVFAAINSVLPTPTEKEQEEVAEGEEQLPQPITVSSVARAIVTMMRPSVKINNRWVANAGVSIQHLPGVLAHGPAPIVAPMAQGEMFMGSSTVMADSAPFSYQYLPALSCNVVGIPAPFRAKKASKPKLTLMAPTDSMITVIPAGMAVLVGGPPTIDLFALAINLGLKGFGKLLKRGKKAIKKVDVEKAIKKVDVEKAAKKVDVEKAVKKVEVKKSSKTKCVGEPVDVVAGRVVSENEEFSFPGAIPFVFTRRYYSDIQATSALGKMWHHNYDVYHSDVNPEGDIVVRIEDGRFITFPALADHDTMYHPIEKFTWSKTKNGYVLEDEYKLQYHFGSNRKLAFIKNTIGDKISVKYNANNNIDSVTDTAGRVLKFSYNNPEYINLLTTIELETKEGFVWNHNYKYNSEGLLHKVIDVNSAEKTFRYKDGLLSHLTNQLGGNFYWEYQGKGENAKCIHAWGDEGLLEYHLDYKVGKTIVTNSLGNTTVYEYDDRLLITKITDPMGGVTINRYNENEEKVLTIDPMGNSTKFNYDQRGNLIAITNAFDNTERFGYNEQDLLVSHTSYQGNSLRRTFNNLGLVTQIDYPNGSTVELDYKKGKLYQITDLNKNTTTLEWDKSHNLTTIHLPNGTATHMTYDSLGRVQKTVAANGATTTYDYDKVGNVLKLIEPTGNVHQFTYNTAGSVLTAKDHKRNVKFSYWGLGHLKKRTENGKSVTFYYDTEEQLKSIRNEAGELYRFSRDGNGNIIGEWGFDGLSRKYRRDANGQVTTTISPLHTTNYNYNALGQLTTVHYNNGTYELFSYDKDGNLILAENQDNQVRLQLDKVGNVLQESQNGHLITNTYNNFGQRTQMQSSLGAQLNNQYNPLGELTNSYAAQDKATPWQAAFEYNSMGWEVERLLSGGVTQKTNYDQAGRIKELHVHSQNYEPSKRQYSWNPSNQLEQLIVNGKTTTFNYDALGNLAQANYQQTETIYKVPDRIGNLYKTADRSGYTYDKGGKLLADPEWNYTYDAEGNLIKKIAKNKQAKGFNLIDDGNSHLLTWEYVWNANGSLQKVSNNEGLLTTFEYDALGRRTAKINPLVKNRDNITRFLWDGNVPLHEWTYNHKDRPQLVVNSTGVLTYNNPEPFNNATTWVFNEGSFVPTAKLVNGEHFSIVSDHLGTPIEAYNKEGEKVWACELDIYGKAIKFTGDKTFIPFRYQGQYFDDDLELCYNRFRYYSPESGTYISQDPIRLASGEPNFYAYVSDSNSWVDPLGLVTQMVDGVKMGDWGEKVASKYLSKNGHQVLGSVQNASGHGFDLITKTSDGNINVIEVKTSKSNWRSKSNMSGWTDNNIRKISGNTNGRWANKPKYQDNLMRTIRDAKSKGKLNNKLLQINIDERSIKLKCKS